ncbi:MAG: hypothetical protein K2J38_01485 [Muribaculaceae bacterium]|nr:hypothetical protein [Muribaculaceae bacterium]
MTQTIQWIIVAVVVVVAAVYLFRARRCVSGGCQGCPLSDKCGKGDKLRRGGRQ